MLRDCPNYRCRQRVDRPRILALPADWRSVVCPHCAAVLALVYVGGAASTSDRTHALTASRART